MVLRTSTELLRPKSEAWLCCVLIGAESLCELPKLSEPQIPYLETNDPDTFPPRTSCCLPLGVQRRKEPSQGLHIVRFRKGVLCPHVSSVGRTPPSPLLSH